jgi:membrane fusion protein, heavy metal efflux system
MTRLPFDTSGRRALVTLTALLFSSGACTRGDATDAAATGTAEPAGGAITLWTDSTELFMEHPALIVGAPDKFAVHLTDLTDFAPLRSGRITLTFRPREGGDPVVVVQEVPRAPGIYGPSPTFTRAGTYDLSILVDSPQAKDSLSVPGLRVYASAAEAPKEEEASGESGIPFLKEQQWKTEGFRTAFAMEGDVTASFEASGMLEPQAGRFAQVSAPVGGLVDAASLASAPAPGQRVARGQVLAVLAPSLGEGGGAAIAEARARLREAQDEYDRAKRLLAVEAVPERRVHEAEIRLGAAREALAGYGSEDGGRIVVRSPLAGVVAARRVTPGSRVEGGAPLFTIVDPSVLWLRVNVPAAQGSDVSRASGAEFQVEGAARTWVARRVVSIGSVIDSLSRTIPVLYEVDNRDGALKVGANARVAVRTGRRETGVLIPADAVLDEDGRPVAYVQPEGESFEKRTLTLGAREGDRVLVRSGIAAGERVVTGAAYQVRLASLSTSVPAQGHEH